MAGNVLEWVEDDWHENYNGAPADGSAWVDAPRSSRRVLRGGSWGLTADSAQAGSRGDHRNLAASSSLLGFRLARSAR